MTSRLGGKDGCAHCEFVLVEYRREEQRLFAGTYIHRLVGEGDAMRIALKKIDLVSYDAPLDGLVAPF